MSRDIFKKIIKIASQVWLFFLDLIFPIECLGCGVEGTWICATCFKKINLKMRQYCLHCKKENRFGQFCQSCGINYHLDGVWIATLYDDRLINQTIKNFKYNFISDLAGSLGEILILFVDNLIKQRQILKFSLRDGLGGKILNQIKETPVAILNFKDNLVVPVPLSAKRLRWRGFNQALILAEILAKNYGLESNSTSLIRIKHKKPQAKLSEAGRLENVKNCFVWCGDNLAKRNVILIDDVVTTGATLNECAKILKANGAGEVWGLVVAKG